MILNLEKPENRQYGDPQDGGKYMKVCRHGNFIQATTYAAAQSIRNDEFCQRCRWQLENRKKGNRKA